ncbi:hypothetical protein WR25_19026 [Diploscapter pachys]|uniref:ZP domain-containing protein n=1 Tax=Diploscapter pachys TaxID=2018661 RepID=A0A2A2JJJ9_9BILA|nr:hypothetical protein WR25_19026 [Diploscapter pachys]
MRFTFNSSDLPENVLTNENEPPNCLYTLHKESQNGPIAKYAQVGDMIYHTWDCPSDVYGMLVHDCFVLDGQGNNHMVIDQNGCSRDTFLMPELIYDHGYTRAVASASAYNFPDQNSLYYNCQIKICYKTDGGCDGITPPRCGASADSSSPSAIKTKDHVEPSEDPITNDIDKEQLITWSTTQESTTTTTTVPSTTTATSTMPSTKTTLILPADFPRPVTMRRFMEEKMKNETKSGKFKAKNPASAEEVEGSGMSDMPTPEALILSPDDQTNGSNSKREIKRREALKKAIDVDISSPELTIVDKDFAAELPSALRSELPQTGFESSGNSSVCLPLIAFWAIGGLAVICFSIILTALCYALKQRAKFNILP